MNLFEVRWIVGVRTNHNAAPGVSKTYLDSRKGKTTRARLRTDRPIRLSKSIEIAHMPCDKMDLVV